jgi:hypothetical protein
MHLLGVQWGLTIKFSGIVRAAQRVPTMQRRSKSNELPETYNLRQGCQPVLNAESDDCCKPA